MFKKLRNIKPFGTKYQTCIGKKTGHQAFLNLFIYVFRKKKERKNDKTKVKKEKTEKKRTKMKKRKEKKAKQIKKEKKRKRKTIENMI